MHLGLVTHVVWVLLTLVKFILSDQMAFSNWKLFGPNPTGSWDLKRSESPDCLEFGSAEGLGGLDLTTLYPVEETQATFS